jgi:hypothetical protein
VLRNIFRTTSMNALAVWAVAPSCWNHMVESLVPRRYGSGVRKFVTFQHNEQMWL